MHIRNQLHFIDNKPNISMHLVYCTIDTYDGSI